MPSLVCVASGRAVRYHGQRDSACALAQVANPPVCRSGIKKKIAEVWGGTLFIKLLQFAVTDGTERKEN